MSHLSVIPNLPALSLYSFIYPAPPSVRLLITHSSLLHPDLSVDAGICDAT